MNINIKKTNYNVTEQDWIKARLQMAESSNMHSDIVDEIRNFDKQKIFVEAITLKQAELISAHVPGSIVLNHVESKKDKRRQLVHDTRVVIGTFTTASSLADKKSCHKVFDHYISTTCSRDVNATLKRFWLVKDSGSASIYVDKLMEKYAVNLLNKFTNTLPSDVSHTNTN